MLNSILNSKANLQVLLLGIEAFSSLTVVKKNNQNLHFSCKYYQMYFLNKTKDSALRRERVKAKEISLRLKEIQLQYQHS